MPSRAEAKVVEGESGRQLLFRESILQARLEIPIKIFAWPASSAVPATITSPWFVFAALPQSPPKSTDKDKGNLFHFLSFPISIGEILPFPRSVPAKRDPASCARSLLLSSYDSVQLLLQFLLWKLLLAPT